jgi:hypothetical protein
MRQRMGCGFAICFGLAQVIWGPGAIAAGAQARNLLQDELKGRVPTNWDVHVSDRGDALLALVAPPYQEAFDLWFEPAQLKEKMLGLCPAADDAVWTALRHQQSIVIQPTVGGKSTDGMQLTCPRGAPQPPA